MQGGGGKKGIITGTGGEGPVRPLKREKPAKKKVGPV